MSKNQGGNNTKSEKKAYEQFVVFKGDTTDTTFLKQGTERLEAGKKFRLRQIEDLTGTEIEADGANLIPVSDEKRKAIIAKHGFSPDYRQVDPNPGYVIGNLDTPPAVVMQITKDHLVLEVPQTDENGKQSTTTVTIGKKSARALPGQTIDEVKKKYRLLLEKLEDKRRAEKMEKQKREEERKHFRAFSGGVYESPYHGVNGAANETPLGLILVLSSYDGVKGTDDRWANVRRVLKTETGYELDKDSVVAAVYLDQNGSKPTQCMFPTDPSVVEKVRNMPEVREVLAKLQTRR
ncbi:MAG TPA: hypothetical protein P5056_01675 [Candidatus Paceibacterota bacterium]|nr:hypothetical protein [Candidatus Paceibacterota bacterium]